MGRRGPKRVDVELLKMYASEWSLYLYMLRDGRPAELYKLVRSERTESDGGREVRIPVTKQIFVGGFHPASDEARMLLEKSPPNPKSGEWFVVPPIPPAPEILTQLLRPHLGIRRKGARSRAEVESVLAYMGRHMPESERGSLEPLLRAARERVADLLKAKRLPHYPRSKRSGSDNKRIDFFAKVLAGLALGLAPATATKRLSNWLPTIPMFSDNPERWARFLQTKGKGGSNE